jgi:hypothetical protein
MGPCFPGSRRQSVFLFSGIVPNGGHYRNSKGTLSRKIVGLPANIASPDTKSLTPRMAHSPDIFFG